MSRFGIRRARRSVTIATLTLHLAEPGLRANAVAQELRELGEQGGRELEKPVRLLKNAAGTDPVLLDSPVGMALLVNLKRRFPCRDKPTKQ